MFCIINNYWLFEILTIQIEYFALRSPISGISFLTNFKETSSFLLHEFNDFRFVIILLYWPYWSLFYLPYRTEFEQGQLKDIHNWGQGYKKCSKINFYYFLDVWYRFSCIWKILPPLPPSPPHNVIIWALPWQLLSCDNSFHLPRSLNNIGVMLLLLFLILWFLYWWKHYVDKNSK